MAVNNSLNINTSTPLDLPRGGTSADLTASNGGLVYTTAAAMAILAGTATAHQIPMSGTSSAPSWSTATYLPTLTANGLLFASAANTMGQITVVDNALLVTSAGGVPSLLANSGTAGFVLTANTGAPPSWQAVSASGAITTIDGDTGSVTPTAGVVTISGGTTGLTTSGAGSTLDLTGVLALANGGTNANLTANDGGIFYSTASAGAILAGTATAHQLLLSGAAGAPSWSTSTYPTTNAINTLLYASAANTMAALATADNGVLITSNAGAPSWLANSITAGYVLTANTGAPPSWQVNVGYTSTTYVATTPYTVLTSDDIILVDTATIAAASSVVLPANPTKDGQVWTVKDWSGSSNLFNIVVTVAGAANSIDGATSYTLNSNYQAVGFAFSVAEGTYSIIYQDNEGLNNLFPWVDQTTTPVTALINTGYITDNGATQVVYTLPSAPAEGTVVRIAGLSAGGWQLLPGAGDSIQIGAVNAATSVTSANQYDQIELLYTGVANLLWVMLSSVSNGFIIV